MTPVFDAITPHPDGVDADDELIHERAYVVRAYRQGVDKLILRGAVRDQKPPGLYFDDVQPLTVHHMIVDLTIAMPFVVVAGLLGFVLIWFLRGREPERPDDIGDYWREVPDDPPAVGRSLLDFGTVDSSAFSATVVDLAQRGYLRISEERTDRLIGKDKVIYRFDAVLHHDVDGLEPWERTVLQRLFPGVESSTQDDLTTWARANQA